MGIDIETGIWDLDAAMGKGHKHDESLLQALFQAFVPAPRMTADLGCGDGWYCHELMDMGWCYVHGYEGSEEMQEHGWLDDLFVLDLTKRRYVEIPYELVLCLEVGEHIPKRHEQVFLDNVAEFAKYASTIVMSWAVPGQGGRGHFNEQPNEYVLEQMWKRGWEPNIQLTDRLREASSLRWFKNTLVGYGRKRIDG